MRFKKSDVEKFKKGLNDQQKTEWLKIVHSAISEYKKEGATDIDAEVRAIKKANAMFSDKNYSDKDFVNPLRGKEEVRLVFAEASDDEGFQLMLPIGLTYSNFYGEIIITRTYCDALVENQHVLKKTEPFLDTEHDRGASNAWLKEMRATEEGLEVRWNFTPRGTRLIQDKEYRYFSASLYEVRDTDTGEYVWPVFVGAALTNKPQMKGMPEAQVLSDNSAHSDGYNIELGEELPVKTLAEILAALMNLSDEEKGKLTEEDQKMIFLALGIKVHEGTDLSEVQNKLDLSEDRVKLLLEENKTLSSDLNTLKKEKLDSRKAEVIKKALSEGKILPKNKEKWEVLFDKDPEGTAEILSEKGSEVDLSENGTGDGGQESSTGEVDPEVRQLLSDQGWSEDEIAQYKEGA